MSRELITILTGATPIGEVRAAIPLALAAFGFSPLKAYLLGVLGNILPILPILLVLNYLSEFLMQNFSFFNKFFNWLFKYTRERHQEHFEKYNFWGALALFVFVAIPLPLTGIWSGCLAAFVFGIPFWRSALAISAGAAAAGLIVLLISLGLISGIHLL